MEFFNQLLTSYNLLKKRKLHVVIDEATAIKSYAHVQQICNSGSEQSEDACNAVNKAYEEANTLQANPQQEFYIRQAEGPKKGQQVRIASYKATEGGQQKLEPAGRRQFDIVRSDLAVYYYQVGLNTEVNQDGQDLSPETTELLNSNDKVKGLLELNDEEQDITLGSQIVGKLGEVYGAAKEVGLGSLFENKPTSIPNKVFESLLGAAKYSGATEEEAKKGRLNLYDRPDPEVVIGALDNLKKILELGKKAGGDETFLPNDYKTIKDNLTIVTGFRAGGYERFRVFVNSNDLNNNTLGLSFDWEERSKPTELQDFITELEGNLERLRDDEQISFEGDPLDKVDRTSLSESKRLGHVIGNVSEDMPAIVTLLKTKTKRGRDAAMALFMKLAKKHEKYKEGEFLGNEIEKAFDLDKDVEAGQLIGTDETTALNVSIQELSEAYGETKYYKIFNKLIPQLLKSVAQEMAALDPYFVARVGGSRTGSSGDPGDKTDIVYFYPNDEEGMERAQNAAKKAGTTVKTKPLGEVVTGDDLTKLLKQRGIDTTPTTKAAKKKLKDELSKEYPYIESSLKCTRDPSRTNAGSTSGPRVIAEEFIGGKNISDKDKQYTNQLIDALHKGVKMKDRASVSAIKANFRRIRDDSRALDKIFVGVGSTSVSEAQAKATLVNALSNTSLGSLGLTTTEQEEIIKKISGANGEPARQTLRRKLEHAMLVKRIENGNEDISWRSVGALMMMRGCYDTHDGTKQVLDYLTGVSYRYNGNKSMMKKFKNYVQSPTGEGWKSSRGAIGEGSMFGIGGYSAMFKQAKETGTIGLDFEAPVDRSNPITGDPEREDSATEYSTSELMNKLLEVQQLIFSSLIKE